MLKSLLRWCVLSIAVLLIGTQSASAQTRCEGEDQAPILQKSDTATWDALRRKADQTKNGKGRLWKIEKPGLKTSYLFGTVHVTDPRVNELPEPLVTILDEIEAVVIETTDVLDPRTVAKALGASPDMTMFTDGTTLMSLVDEKDHALVKAGLSARGIPLVTVQKMKPWLLNGMLSIPACEQKRKSEGKQILDFRLANMAIESKLELQGLESVVEQFDAFTAIDMKEHIDLLVANLRFQDRMDDVVATIIALYLASDLAMIPHVAEHLVPTKDEPDKISGLERYVIIERNHTMARRAVSILNEKSALIAVGALHLPGDEGLIELLRIEGYTMTPVL